MSLLDCLPQAFCRMHYIEKKVLQIQVLAVKCDFLCVCYLNTVVLASSCAGVNYVHQFCVGAAKGVLSPFVLQEIIMEALQRLNPAHVHNHLRTPAFHQLVQRCQQAYMQYIHHRLIHLTPADYDDFVNAIRSARSAFCLTPMGMMQFNDILQNLKRSKQTKELWQRVSLEMTTFSP